MAHSTHTLTELTRSVVEPMGYELVGVEHFQRGGRLGGSILRVYIDAQGGITLDDCVAVSHQLSGVLDVEDPIAGPYTLEISSPGLDRPLFEAKHFARFAGAVVRVQLREPLDGRRKLVGHLLGMRGDDVVIAGSDGQEWEVPLERIEKARLVPQL